MLDEGENIGKYRKEPINKDKLCYRAAKVPEEKEGNGLSFLRTGDSLLPMKGKKLIQNFFTPY